MENPLVETYKDKKCWVNWKIETRDGKETKIPYQPSGIRAKSSDPATWSTFTDLDPTMGEGIIFDYSNNLLGIDLDHFITNGEVDDAFKQTVADLVEKANTYTEVSPSGTGLHLYLQLEKNTKLKKNRHTFEHNGKQYGYEMYTKGRFFTVTQEPYGAVRPVRTVTSKELKDILTIIGYPWAEPGSENGYISNTTGATSVSSISHTPILPTDVDDATILDKMFASKNGATIRALYNGDISMHNNDESVADAALCTHLAFWCDKDAGCVERLWSASPLAGRKKTQKRKDYRTRTVQNAIRTCTDTYNWHDKREKKEVKRLSRADESGEDIDYLCTYTKQGDKLIVCNTENLTRLFAHHPHFKDRLRFDEFSNAMEIRTDGVWHPWRDGDDIAWQCEASTIEPAFMRVSKGIAFDAMMRVAMRNTVNVAHEWMKSLQWDGIPRVDTWLTSAYGTPDNEYYRSVGKNWLMAIAKRTAHPGAKFDHVMVLEGEQGTKKSTSLYILGNILPNRIWHLETTLDTSNKDFFVTLQGKLIVEFSEGESLTRSEVKQMKAIITTQVDTFRAPYGRTSQEYPRRCVFAMTTNMEEYLKDETGNRRWLPVHIEKEVDLDWLRENRDQLYAEAYERVVRKNECYWDFPQEEIQRMQDERRVSSSNEESIIDWYSHVSQAQRDEGITTKEVWQGAYHGGVSMGSVMKKYEEMEITDVLKRVLKLERRRLMIDGVRRWRWYERENMKSPVQFTKDEWGKMVEVIEEDD